MFNNGIYYEIQDEKAQENLNKARAYMPYIYEDARSYKAAMERGDYNKAVSDAQQVGEKSLKAIATKSGQLSKTLMAGSNGHNLKKLITACKPLDLGISKQDINQLTKSYFLSRYPEGKKKYSENEAYDAGFTACKLLDKAAEELDIPYSALEKELGTVENQDNIGMLGSFKRLMK